MKIKFVIPTIFVRPELETLCINEFYTHIKKHNIENKLIVVCNTHNEKFISTKFVSDEIVKKISGEQHNISKAINEAAKEPDTESFDYFCLCHSDIFFQNEKWINSFINVSEKLNAGTIGIVRHTGLGGFDGYNKKVNKELFNINEIYEVLWADGILFFKTKIFKEVGLFNENYLGDCEQNDFCYKCLKAGYKNYFIHPIEFNIRHIQAPWGEKSTQTTLLLNQVNESRKLFHTTWDEFIIDYKQKNK